MNFQICINFVQVISLGDEILCHFVVILSIIHNKTQYIIHQIKAFC